MDFKSFLESVDYSPIKRMRVMLKNRHNRHTADKKPKSVVKKQDVKQLPLNTSKPTQDENDNLQTISDQ